MCSSFILKPQPCALLHFVSYDILIKTAELTNQIVIHSITTLPFEYRRGRRDRMVVGFTTTYAISVSHH